MDPRLFSLLCVVLGGMGQGIVAPKLPEILETTNADTGSFLFASGMSGSLMYLGIFVSTYFYGSLADRGFFHRLLAFGLFAYGVSLFSLGFVSSEWMLFVVRFLEGMAISAVFVAADYALGRLSPPDTRGQWLSYYGVALSVGLLLGPTLSLLSARFLGGHPQFPFLTSVRLPLFFVGSLTFVLGIISLRFRLVEAETEDKTVAKLNRAALFSGGSYGFMESALVAVFPILAVQIFKVVPEYCLLVTILTAAITSLAWGMAADKVGSRRILVYLNLLLLCLPASLAVLSFGLSPQITAYVSCIIFGTIAGGLYPVGFSYLLESIPTSQYGYASGGFARAYGMGSLLGPLLGGVGSQYFGPQGFFFMISIAGIISFWALLKDPLRARL